MVAVDVPCFPPFQHSPIFGHLASSQTVCKLRLRNCSLILAKLCPVGMKVLSHGGNLKLSLSSLFRRNFPS